MFSGCDEINKAQLVSLLKKVREDGYDTDQDTLRAYTGSMLKYIGDTDPELRDELIYETFCCWICDKGYFSCSELLMIADTLIDDHHLFYKIGNEGDDSVFTRTFSILVIVLVLCRHREKHFIDRVEFEKIKNAVIRYYEEERDLRGYVENFGWAHAAAHCADALDELVRCPEFDKNTRDEVLDAIKKVLFNGRYFLSNEEDERIARVVYRMLLTESLPGSVLSEWLDSLAACLDWEKNRQQYISRVNAKNFIRSLYFRVMHSSEASSSGQAFYKAEERLNRFISEDMRK